MRFRSSPCVSLTRFVWLARLALCRAWLLSLGACNHSMRRHVVNAVWLADAALVLSERLTLAPPRLLWFYWVEKYGRDI